MAVYLDGMSRGLHGDPKPARDQLIREMLELDGYTVIVVQSRDLNDPQAVRQHLRNIAQAIGRADLPVFNEGTAPADARENAEARRSSRNCWSMRRAVPGLGAGLCRDKSPLPEVGYELQDEQGRVCAEAELAWPSKKWPCCCRNRPRRRRCSSSQGWKVFPRRRAGRSSSTP